MNNFHLIMISAWHEQAGNCTHRLLDSHPQLDVYPFESTMATSLSSNLLAGPMHPIPQRYAYPEFGSETTPEQAYHAMADHELKPYLRARHTSKFKDCGLVMDEQKRIKRFVELCDGLGFCAREGVVGPHERKDYIEAYLRATFDTWENRARTGRETHYVGYIPPLLLDADKFFADFPSGHMIHVIRNPWSGYADTLKRPYPFSLSRYCQIWSTCCQQASVYQRKYADRFHIVQFEDIVHGPEGALNPVLAQIGLDPLPLDVRPSFNRQPLAQVYPWGTIRHITPEANTATARELTEAQVAAIELECGPMLERWDYQRHDFEL